MTCTCAYQANIKSFGTSSYSSRICMGLYPFVGVIKLWCSTQTLFLLVGVSTPGGPWTDE
jgi:hypothetical protein